MKKIAVLGSTGSIGTQTLEIVRTNKDIQVTALAAGSNIELLEAQIREFSPKLAAVWDEEKAVELKSRVRDLDVRVFSGMDGLLAVAAEPEATVPLLLNGEPVSFSDAAPIFWGDAIDVPAAATLEALGYEITWDEASQTILAEQDGAALSLTIGDATAHRSGTGGSEEIISLSKAPYVDPATWRTYFSAEDLSLLLGDPYRTAVDYGWTMDSAGGLVMSYGEMAVIVDDVDAILAENTETYERMDQYLDYAR